MTTENKGNYFKELKLQNVRCFGDEAILKLCNEKGEWQRWNIILGENGTGKTTLLQCLAGMEQKISKKKFENTNYEVQISESIFLSYNNNNNFIKISNLNEIDAFEDHTIVSCEVIKNDNKIITVGFIQFDRIFIHSGKFGIIISEEKDELDIFILGYGANRFMSSKVLLGENFNSATSATLFDADAKLINIEEWFLQRDYAILRNANPKAAEANRQKIFELLKGILPDISNIRIVGNIHNIPKIEFETPYGWVGMQNLSFGYKSMVAWILDVYARMIEKYPNSENPLSEPVIILVDEIDLHLHPKWQRQIFTFLEKRFPKAQFIVTAHSPLIVQSAPKDANIIVLKKIKEENSSEYVVKINNDKNFVKNWRIDQILASDLFDIGIRNPEVEQQMEERTQLLKKKNLNETEKARLNVLNEISDSLPTAGNLLDIDAMELIRKAANYIKNNP